MNETHENIFYFRIKYEAYHPNLKKIQSQKQLIQIMQSHRNTSD